MRQGTRLLKTYWWVLDCYWTW